MINGFPFTIKYSKRLKEKVTASDTAKVLNYIGDFITEKTVEDITIEGNELTFKSGFFRMRWSTNIMGAIEKGKFNLLDNGHESILTYEFFMYRTFAIVAVMSVFMGTVSKQPWFGVVCFAWLGGMNWLTAVIRHRNMLGDIAGGCLTSDKSGQKLRKIKRQIHCQLISNFNLSCTQERANRSLWK